MEEQEVGVVVYGTAAAVERWIAKSLQWILIDTNERSRMHFATPAHFTWAAADVVARTPGPRGSRCWPPGTQPVVVVVV